MYEKREKISVCVKIKYNELPGSLKLIRNFKVSRLKDSNSFFQSCAIQ
jgi:hypothetical protein